MQMNNEEINSLCDRLIEKFGNERDALFYSIMVLDGLRDHANINNEIMGSKDSYSHHNAYSRHRKDLIEHFNCLKGINDESK